MKKNNFNTKKNSNSNRILNFMEPFSKNFFSKLYAIDSSENDKPINLELDMERMNFKNDEERWLFLQEKFNLRFPLKLNNFFFIFLKEYVQYFKSGNKNFDKEFELLNFYWEIIDEFKNSGNKNFNKYIILINENIYKSQKGLKVKNLK